MPTSSLPSDTQHYNLGSETLHLKLTDTAIASNHSHLLFSNTSIKGTQRRLSNRRGIRGALGVATGSLFGRNRMCPSGTAGWARQQSHHQMQQQHTSLASRLAVFFEACDNGSDGACFRQHSGFNLICFITPPRRRIPHGDRRCTGSSCHVSYTATHKTLKKN